jgi:CheY-like chemotaxis protein
MTNILIADDDPDLLAGIKEYFTNKKNLYEVHTALNGKEAVKILKSSPVDIVVTDLKMPEMDGIELLAFIKNDYPNIPTLIMSAFGTQKIKDKIEKIGTFPFLDKPFDLADLSRIVENELQRICQKGHVNDISPGAFLQLIEMEEKTCFLEVAGKNDKKGYLYFKRGVLYDALQDDNRGEAAVIEILSWDKVQISFKGLPKKELPKRIKSKVIPLIMKSTTKKGAGATQARSNDIEVEGDEDIEIERNKDIEVEEDKDIASPEEKSVDFEDYDQKIKSYFNFDGFLGVGLYDTQGSPIWLHSQKKIYLKEAGALVAATLSAIQSFEMKETQDSSQSLYMETENAHAFLDWAENKSVSSPSENEMGYNIILIASNSLPIGFVKKKFDTVKENIFEELKDLHQRLRKNG